MLHFRLCGKNFQAKGDLPKHWLTKRHDKDRPHVGTERWNMLIQQSVRVPSMSDSKKNTTRKKPKVDMVRRAADDFAVAGPSGIGAQNVAPAAAPVETRDAIVVNQPAFPGNPIPPPTYFAKKSAPPPVVDQPAFPGNPMPPQFIPPGPPPPPIFGPGCPSPFFVVPPSPVPQYQYQLQVGQEQVPQFHPVYSSK